MTIAFTILFLSFFIPAFLLRHTFYEKIKTRRLIKKGVEAQAVLLNVEPTGMHINKQLQVQLQMQVYPVLGRNFVVEVREVMDYSDFKQLQAGDMVLVKYNPSNTKEVIVLML
jgi:hypothetical protein